MKCTKCKKKLSPEEVKEYGILCNYCMVRYLSASFCQNKKDAQRILNMSDEEVEEGMKRIAEVMAQTMLTAKQFYNKISFAFRALSKLGGYDE